MVTILIAALCVMGGSLLFFFYHQIYTKKLDVLHTEKAVLETSLQYAEKEKQELVLRLTEKETQYHEASRACFEAEKKTELLEQKLTTEQTQLERWKADQERHLELTRASILKAGSEMSSKLLDDHKRESAAAHTTNEARIRQVTETLHEQFKHISESMHTVHSKMAKMDVIERALLSPQGAGNLAEITLENIFKASGLIEGQDYRLQYWVEKQDDTMAAKPDAVVFLPGNQVMVVDSKASKFFMDIEQSADRSGEDSKKHEAGLKQTMGQHLKDLIHRNYRQGIIAQLQKDRPIKEQYQIIMMMFLPTESAVERLHNIDGQFQKKAWEHHIIPVGPAGLVNALLQSRQMIFCALQEQHSSQIIEDVKKLLGSVVTLYTLSESLGKSIKTVFEKYDKFAASFNRNFLSKARKLHKQGVTSNDQVLQRQLERYQVVTAAGVLDNEVLEEDETVKQLEHIEAA